MSLRPESTESHSSRNSTLRAISVLQRALDIMNPRWKDDDLAPRTADDEQDPVGPRDGEYPTDAGEISTAQANTSLISSMSDDTTLTNPTADIDTNDMPANNVAGLQTEKVGGTGVPGAIAEETGFEDSVVYPSLSNSIDGEVIEPQIEESEPAGEPIAPLQSSPILAPDISQNQHTGKFSDPSPKFSISLNQAVI